MIFFWRKMAEKTSQTAASDYISVVVNFKNLRFMTLVKENYLISDLINEVESTFTKLCSMTVKIKTLKNAVNAVLPNWYPVAPLIKNQDEIFAFTDNVAEVLNIDLTKHGNSSSFAISPLGSGVMADSGFTSPIVKLGTFRESDEPLEQKGIEGDGVQRQEDPNKPDYNFSQDEGNELLSETFSLQDYKNDKDVGGEGKKSVANPGKTFGQKQNTKAADKNLKETTNLQRSEKMDENLNELEEENVENFAKDNQGKKEVSKSKEKSVPSDSESSDDGSDSSWKSMECSKKVHGVKKQQNKSSQNNNNLESLGAVTKAKETEKASETAKLTERAQNKSSAQNLNSKRAPFNMRVKLLKKKSVLGAARHESDSSEESIDEEMDIEKKHGNKNMKLTRKWTHVSGEKNDENMEVDAENVREKNSELISKTDLPKSAVNTGNKESESSDSSFESDNMEVDEGGGKATNSKGKAKTVESEKVENGKNALGKISSKKGNKIGGKTRIADGQSDCNKIRQDTAKKTDDSKNKKETKAPETSIATKDNGNAIPKIAFISDKDVRKCSTDNESTVGGQEGKTKTVKGKLPASIKKQQGEKANTITKGKGDTEKLDTKYGTTKMNLSRKDESSSDSSDSSSDSDSGELSKNPSKKPKTSNEKNNDNVSKNRINIIDITMKDMAKETENVKETNGSKKGENKDVAKAKPGEERDLSSDSSWSSSDDEDMEVKILKNGNETRPGKGESRTDVIDGDKSRSKNESQTTQASKSCSKNVVEDNTIKAKGKRKDTVKIDDKDKQTNLDPAPSPAKSVRHKKVKGNLDKNTPASPAKSITRSKKGGSSKADLTKIDVNSGSSVSTLKAPFTQLHGNDKGDSKSESSSGDEDAMKKGEKILKGGTKKGKHNSTDKKSGDGAATPAKDPNTSILFPKTPQASTPRKSAKLLSASKVASWLLSNPVSEAELTSNEAKSPQTTKTRLKNKTNDNTTSLLEATTSETALPTKNSNGRTKENVVKTLLSPQGTTPSQKRKLDEVSEQEQSTKSKKNKKKNSEKGKNEKELNKETQDNQGKLPVKTPVTTKKGKNTSISLPKVSKGLSALLEDESDYSTKNNKRFKKQKLTPPTITRHLKPTGFLTPSDTAGRKATSSKTPKSRIKKTPSSQPSKNIEMNAKEQEILESGALNLEILLNDESIKW